MLEKPVLIGSRVILRPITPADAPAMFASLSDEEGRLLTGTQKTFTLQQVQEHCQWVVGADDRADFAITLKDGGEFVGEAVLKDIDRVNRTAGFRIALAGQPFLGKGYGTEATRLLVDYGMRTLKLHRIELEVYDFNPRAQHVYEKVGFVREGVRRDVLLWDGVYHSAIVMGLLEHEFRPEELAGGPRVQAR